ncbi:uncharacterized protein [Dermacentor albipictus]|uniref:uncharacterized protein isoform X1 n=1 Tax=Dermacentor albipictus TaxID=60249 RepID=UPI0038FCF8E3
MGTQTAVFDATGKYPTGVLQVTRVDLGAFDECLETEVRDSSGNVSSRGQYCNLQIQPKTDALGPKEMEFVSAMVHPKILDFMGAVKEQETPLIRIGICFLDDCNESDLQALADAVQPPMAEIRVSNCVTAEPEPWSSLQIGIVNAAGSCGGVLGSGQHTANCFTLPKERMQTTTRCALSTACGPSASATLCWAIPSRSCQTPGLIQSQREGNDEDDDT